MRAESSSLQCERGPAPFSTRLGVVWEGQGLEQEEPADLTGPTTVATLMAWQKRGLERMLLMSCVDTAPGFEQTDLCSPRRQAWAQGQQLQSL